MKETANDQTAISPASAVFRRARSGQRNSQSAGFSRKRGRRRYRGRRYLDRIGGSARDRELDEGARRRLCPLRPALALPGQGRASHSLSTQSAATGRRHGAYAAAPARRDDHAQRLAFRAQPFRHSDIDPDQHRLVIHGHVRRPLVFTVEALHRYPMQSRIAFIECAGNSGALNAPQAQPLGIAAIHGLLGCSEWTGVKVSTLLDEAGVDPSAHWVIAEGADAAGMSRSIPLAKVMDDALLCLYQNGEAVRSSNGYPVRLLLPGFEGNMNVKWLRRLKLTSGPAMTKDETSKYTILLKDEKAWQFVFPIEVKSVITRPAPGITLTGSGFYEISGLAWSGNSSIRQVEVSADGGQSWAQAALQGPILPKAPVRFRAAWQWNGGAAVLQSRATDDTGMVQPTRAAFAAERGLRGVYHYNAIASWRIDEKGEATNVYA